MAKRIDSIECANSELDLFTVPFTQTSIVGGSWVKISCSSKLESNVLKFELTSTNSEYVSLSDTQLFVKVKITKTDRNEEKGFNDTDDKSVGVANNTLHTLFSQVQIYLNNKIVENNNARYMQRAYLENLLCYSKEAKEILLEREGWVKDKFDVDKETANTGWAERRKKFFDKNEVQLSGKLHCDMFNTNKLLLNNVSVRVELTRNDPKFVIKGEAAQCEPYNFTFTEAYLMMRRVEISPSVMLAHAMALEKTTAKYPIKRVFVNYHHVTPSTNKAIISNIHHGIVPNRILFFFLANNSHYGAFDTNQFNYKHLDISRFKLTVGNKCYPYAEPLELDFDKNSYAQAYSLIFKNIREAPNDISYSDYKNGNTVFAFDLTPDLCSEDHYSLLKDGSIDLEIDFNKPTTNALVCYTYSEFDNIVEITKERNVFYDYNV